jgi:4-hydroxy-tetrahydrodipicolinate synthase
MRATDWRGVFPAITTPFHEDLSVDHDSLRDHVSWLVERGSTGIVALGSLGEAATMTFDEKVQVFESCKAATGDKVPLVAGISALSTHEAVELARAAQRVGCEGLMALPPYVYRSEWREMKAHMEAIITATPLSCMLYNNPVAYGTDFLPEHIEELCVHENLHAVKESSADIRRVTAIRALIGDRLAIFVGVDDLIVEGIAAGAVGWIAGLVNALPDESVRLFELATAGEKDATRSLYEWFLPLLRLDLGPKFVQTIKLVQEELGRGSARVRPPRLELEGAELDAVMSIIREQLAARPVA